MHFLLKERFPVHGISTGDFWKVHVRLRALPSVLPSETQVIFALISPDFALNVLSAHCFPDTVGNEHSTHLGSQRRQFRCFMELIPCWSTRRGRCSLGFCTPRAFLILKQPLDLGHSTGLAERSWWFVFIICSLPRPNPTGGHEDCVQNVSKQEINFTNLSFKLSKDAFHS